MDRNKPTGDDGAVPQRYISGTAAPSMPQAHPMTDDLDLRRKRLLFRSWHRGTKEADLLMGSFAEQHLGAFSLEQLDRYEALLERDDDVLIDWLIRRVPPPAEAGNDVLRLLLAFKYTARPA
jgi:antitoxin CptB